MMQIKVGGAKKLGRKSGYVAKNEAQQDSWRYGKRIKDTGTEASSQLKIL